MRYQRPKGTADILPGESIKWQYVEDQARRIFKTYDYQEIRTPMFESYEVFSRSAGGWVFATFTVFALLIALLLYIYNLAMGISVLIKRQ